MLWMADRPRRSGGVRGRAGARGGRAEREAGGDRDGDCREAAASRGRADSAEAT
jgi:hypothetical protein